MLRRSVLQLSSRRSVKGVLSKTTSQFPSYLSSRRLFSVSHKNESYKPDLGSNAPGSRSNTSKIVVGSFALGSIIIAAYYNGVLDRYFGQEQQSYMEPSKVHTVDKTIQEVPEDMKRPQSSELREPSVENSLQDANMSTFNADHIKEHTKGQSEINMPDDLIRTEGDESIPANDTATQFQDRFNLVNDKEPINEPCDSISSIDASIRPSEESFVLNTQGVKADEEQHNAIDITSTFTLSEVYPNIEIGNQSVPKEQISSNGIKEVDLDDETKLSSSLLDDYLLGVNIEDMQASSSNGQKENDSITENAYEGYILKDGKLVIDFLQAIHAAEKRQAELDAHSFAVEKRAMKERYEKELKDARARELMYAEREAILDKELNKEKARAAATLKTHEEKFMEKLRSELEKKDSEAEAKMKKIHDLAKAELTAAIASEKASQIEKMAEANLHISALCMAFYAHSEEARQSHAAQKLALAALVLEDVLSKGLPVQKEIETLHNNLEGVDQDSLIALAISSLSEDTLKNGIDTLLQLNHKFDLMKGTLRHYSLIPPAGGGMLSHSLARIASLLKVKEVDHSGDGIESLINKVDILLAQGKLCEAADTLENGVKYSQAAEVVNDWARRARNRAITEQALTVLQSYAITMSVT